MAANRKSGHRALFERGWRYTLIGAVCAFVNYIIMLIVDAVGWHYLLGTVIAFFVTAPLGYLLHSRFTFGESLGIRPFLRFVVGVAGAWPLAAILMIILCSGLRLSVAVATPIATVIIFAWNFTAAHWAIRWGRLTSAQSALNPRT